MGQGGRQENSNAKRNTWIFGLLMLGTQIAVCLIYGFLIDIPSAYINTSSVLLTILLAILTVAGFGLVFSNIKKLAWSGIGFTFLITALCIQLYPLINAFWTKVRIQNGPGIQDFSDKYYTLFLSNASLKADQTWGNCITNAIKCGLAISVAFSSVVGRAGPLECYIASALGIVGFELNRQIIQKLAPDSFGSFYIFTFGGFMGLAMGFLLRLRESKHEAGLSTEQNELNTSAVFNSSYSLFGTLIIFVLFPLLAYDVDTSISFKQYQLVNGPLSIIIGMGASLLGAYAVSSFFNGNVIIRDIIHAPIAGGIVVGAASYFITNPVYALVAGFSGGALQTVIQNLVEKRVARQKAILSTISWSLFGIQGIVGGLFATGYRHILDTNSNGFNYNGLIDYNPGYELLIAVISAGIGLGFGLIAGGLLLATAVHSYRDHFLDRIYWITDDGITFPKAKQVETLPLAKTEGPIKDHKEPEPEQITEHLESVVELDMSFSEGEEVKNIHTFL